MDFSKLKTYIDTIKEASNVLSMLMEKPSLKYDDIVSVMAMNNSLFATQDNDPEKWCDEMLNRLKKYNIDYLKYDMYEERTVDMKEKMQKYDLLLHELDTKLKIDGLYDPDKYKRLIWTTTKNDERANKLIPKIAGVFSQMSTNMTNLNYLFEEVQEGIKKLSCKLKVDKRGNVIDFFKNQSRMDDVRKESNGKTGAALVSVFLRYIKDGTLETFPSYGSLVKDWNFPDDKRLENRYKEAKKGKR